MLDVPLPLLVAIAGFVAVTLAGLVIIIGGVAVRRLHLPVDPPESLAFEPPTPALHPAGDPVAARARAAESAAIAALGAQARAVCNAARETMDLAEWVATCDATKANAARTAATEAHQAAQRAGNAFATRSLQDLEAAKLAAATATQRIHALAANLPDWRSAERRKLLWLTVLLLGTVAFATALICLR